LHVRGAGVVGGVGFFLSDAVLIPVLRLASFLAHVIADERSFSWWRLEDDGRLRRGSQTGFVIGITILTATPRCLGDVSDGSRCYVCIKAYHVECDESIDLDEAMKVSKNDGKRQEDEIGGVPLEESHELDHLGKGKHEDELSPEGVLAACEIPVRSRPPAGRQKKGVNSKCQGGEGCNVEGVGAPGLLSDPGVRF
jgi:hypothetical protein